MSFGRRVDFPTPVGENGSSLHLQDVWILQAWETQGDQDPVTF